MWEERGGSWEKMRVSWIDEWECFVNYSKRDSRRHEIRFPMMVSGCPPAGEVMDMLKEQMKAHCPEAEQAEMFG